MDKYVYGASYTGNTLLETPEGLVLIPGILTLIMSDGDEVVVDLSLINDNESATEGIQNAS